MWPANSGAGEEDVDVSLPGQIARHCPVVNMRNRAVGVAGQHRDTAQQHVQTADLGV